MDDKNKAQKPTPRWEVSAEDRCPKCGELALLLIRVREGIEYVDAEKCPHNHYKKVWR